MKVYELIEKLSHYKAGAEVQIDVPDGEPQVVTTVRGYDDDGDDTADSDAVFLEVKKMVDV